MGTPGVARVVRYLRPRRGMSLVDLARAAEVPESELEAFEGRERPLSSSQLRRVAAALELEFAALMRGEAVEEPQPALFFRHFGSPDLHEGDRESLAATLREAEALASVSAILDPDAGVRGEIVPARPGSTHHGGDRPEAQGVEPEPRLAARAERDGRAVGHRRVGRPTGQQRVGERGRFVGRGPAAGGGAVRVRVPRRRVDERGAAGARAGGAATSASSLISRRTRWRPGRSPRGGCAGPRRPS